MAVLAVIVAILSIIAGIAVLIFTELFTEMMVPFWFIMAFLLIILMLGIIFELQEQKRAKAGLDTWGDSIRGVAMLAKEQPRLIVISILIVLSFFSIFVFLFMLNKTIGFIVFIAFLIAMLALAERGPKAAKTKTVESYIASKSKRVQVALWEIHNSILEAMPSVAYGLCSLPAPVYFYGDSETSEQDGMGSGMFAPQSFYELIIVQALLGGKVICVYPINPLVFEVFADRISKYSTFGANEIRMPLESIDHVLIKDIVLYNKACIDQNRGIWAPPAL